MLRVLYWMRYDLKMRLQVGDISNFTSWFCRVVLGRTKIITYHEYSLVNLCGNFDVIVHFTLLNQLVTLALDFVACFVV